ncbi:hypothetical protein GLAREA_08039 [Glarea lozoyensis ATCC 20868]|uniref:DNA mismatch repair protein HSM3 N-terminal domain-containing protein n=1 Tax=Glarea lozoyensis (strain ATCC 20868 / MF5171) TaxID=1116229 RepID=S3CG03_GLAL2|nr:uncharacterized protein GLAREA_08039 [Glarea lozoyensis ATCC 20868]EPE24189.1 hypothetical protein GLAREA_08039 [Glarea lozoyensis ATCC 20868]
MAQVKVSGLEDLEAHLRQVIAFPDTQLDAKLFDDVELQLNETNIPPIIPRLLPQLTQILLTYEKDPSLLASMIIKLLRPMKFTEALTLASEDALIQALRSPAPSANLLAMTIIGKATRSPGDTAILSIMKGVIESLIHTWLSTPHVEVGERATQMLGDLLEVDCDRRISAGIDTKMSGLQIAGGMAPGQGLLWRRIFHDREIYGLLLSLCSFHTSGDGEHQLDKRQKSLAQGRLLRLLPRLSCLDFYTVSHSQFPDIDRQYGIPDGEEGLLYFAMVDMVNKEEDMLMHITLIDLFVELLVVMSTTELTQTTMKYLANLVNTVAGADKTLYKSLESIARNPESPPELVDLLVKLSE